jgi:heme/copper-type cytochrome/quinol oxidase subunit 2
MRKIAIRYLLSMPAAFLVALAIPLPQSSSVLAQDQSVRVIEVTAKKYEYSPSPIHVKVGTKVQLKITAKDHDHGFRIATVLDGAEPNGTRWVSFHFVAKLLAA